MIVCFILGFIFFFALLIVLSFHVLKPNEITIRTTWGKPGKKFGPGGICWAIPIVQKINRYPNDVMEFEFTVPSVMTRRGYVDGYSDTCVEPAEIDIVCSLYAQFDKNKLEQTIENTDAIDADGLGPMIVPYAMGIIRALGSRLPWRLTNQERHYFSDWVIVRLIGSIAYKKIDKPRKEKKNTKDEDVFGPGDTGYEDGDPLDVSDNSPFVKFGLTNIALAIKDVNFADENESYQEGKMRSALSAAEKARLIAKATVLSAEAEKIKRQKEGEGAALAREKMLEIIKKAGVDLELLYTLREMATGTSNTILYQIPPTFARKMEEMLGGNSIEKVFSQLNPAEKGRVVKAINKLLAKK